MSAAHPGTDVHTSNHLSVLPHEECLALLGTTTVGRIAFTNADGPQLIPINFAVIDGRIYVRTSSDSMLRDIAHIGGEVALGVDHHAEVYREGWNVTVKGPAIEVSDSAVHAEVMSWARLRPWAGGTRAVVIEVVPRSIEGRRVHGA